MPSVSSVGDLLNYYKDSFPHFSPPDVMKDIAEVIKAKESGASTSKTQFSALQSTGRNERYSRSNKGKGKRCFYI